MSLPRGGGGGYNLNHFKIYMYYRTFQNLSADEIFVIDYIKLMRFWTILTASIKFGA